MSELDEADRYMQFTLRRLESARSQNRDSLARAISVVATSISNGGMVYLFGTGHSHMMAEEAHYRAGGLAATCPILCGATMLHDGAAGWTSLESQPLIAEAALARYPISNGDVLVVFSNSGRNEVSLESARIGKRAGATLLGFFSGEYAATTPDGDRESLADLVDISFDTCGPIGDALMPIDEGLSAGPYSTIGSAFLWNAIVVGVATRLAHEDLRSPVYKSSRMPGAAEHNAVLIARYRPRNPHL